MFFSISNINKYTRNPSLLAQGILRRLTFLPDSIYLKLMYRLKLGKPLNLENPVTYNEKLQWLKLYYRKEEMITLVDKVDVKEYLSNIVDRKYVVPTLAIYDKVSEINWESLPEKYVVKTTNGGGNTSVFICRDKSTFDTQKVSAKLSEALKVDFYKHSREWPYKNVKPRIIVEELLEDSKSNDLPDYKFLCFDGVPELLFIATGRQENPEPYFNFYDMYGKELELMQGHPRNPIAPELPINFELMKELSSKISSEYPHMRVDFYEVNGQVFIGELTFFHLAGFRPFNPESWDEYLGNLIKLPNKN